MSGFPGSPRLQKGAILLVDPESAAVIRRVALQYNPDQISRSLQIAAEGGEAGRSGPIRSRVPPVETIKLEAEVDATDPMETAAPGAPNLGVGPQIAALETLVYPSTTDLRALDVLSRSGTLEIAAPDPALTLFAWNAQRLVPVRITELSITEEAFTPDLQPIRAKVSLTMRVLSVHDLGFDHKGGSLYMIYQQTKEILAALASTGPGRIS
jgi:Contractile injection system tube protein